MSQLRLMGPTTAEWLADCATRADDMVTVVHLPDSDTLHVIRTEAELESARSHLDRRTRHWYLVRQEDINTEHAQEAN